MLRALLLVMFLAANAALAAVHLGWLKWRDVLPETGREPARINTQLDPAHIRLTGADISRPTPASAAASAADTPDSASGSHAESEAPASSAPASSATAASQALAATAPAAVSGDAAASQAAAAVAASSCLDVGPFAASDAQQARGLLLAALPAGQGDIQSIAVDKRYWVHLDPVPNKAAADKQVAQLRSAGVTEYFLVNDEGPALVVSLGLFNDKDRATRLMAIAQKKGLTPQLSERPNAKSRIVYRIAGINANAATQVRGVVTQQWSAQLLKACPAPSGSPPAASR
ncbi:SPOR domain-containing protein [Pandoraea anhela]|uniref:SPOR domain-containing protein n=1 Tax=Pandoraea anhela TaxID=2508295 RepID=A0A5E4SDV5_9BURK|nr:SPOR domain-containing protein [Pandoraea anhela]VVD72348.1 SPOR domain-containing protein [Pandoraea anhela]